MFFNFLKTKFKTYDIINIYNIKKRDYLTIVKLQTLTINKRGNGIRGGHHVTLFKNHIT